MRGEVCFGGGREQRGGGEVLGEEFVGVLVAAGGGGSATAGRGAPLLVGDFAEGGGGFGRGEVGGRVG